MEPQEVHRPDSGPPALFPRQRRLPPSSCALCTDLGGKGAWLPSSSSHADAGGCGAGADALPSSFIGRRGQGGATPGGCPHVLEHLPCEADSTLAPGEPRRGSDAAPKTPTCRWETWPRGGACRRHSSVGSSGSPGMEPCGGGATATPSALPEELGLPGASPSLSLPPVWTGLVLGAQRGKRPHLRAAELASGSLSGCPLESSGSFKNDPRQAPPKTTALPSAPPHGSR